MTETEVKGQKASIAGISVMLSPLEEALSHCTLSDTQAATATLFKAGCVYMHISKELPYFETIGRECLNQALRQSMYEHHPAAEEMKRTYDLLMAE